MALVRARRLLLRLRLRSTWVPLQLVCWVTRPLRTPARVLRVLRLRARSGSSTSGSDGVGSGTQVVAPITAPINLGATSAGLLGDSSATNTGTSGGTAPTGTNSGSTTSGSDGIGSGTQVVAPITAPINLGATSAGLLGDSSATNTGTGSSGTSAPGTSGSSTSGSDGILSGTQLIIPITAPVSLGATSVGIGGGSTATVNPPVVNPPVVNPPVVNPPVVNPPVVNPPVVNPPVVNPPVVNPPVVNPPVVNPPVVNPPGGEPCRWRNRRQRSCKWQLARAWAPRPAP